MSYSAPMKSSAARAALRETLALGSSAPLRSSAARAALREALALGSSAPLRSSAARAALRGESPLPHLLQRAMACEAIVVSLVGMTRFFRWCCRRPTCLQSCARANNHGLTGMARCNKCGSGGAAIRLAPRSAARAALDLKSTTQFKTCASNPPLSQACRAFFKRNATYNSAIHPGINITEIRIGGVRYITTRISTMNARHR